MDQFSFEVSVVGSNWLEPTEIDLTGKIDFKALKIMGQLFVKLVSLVLTGWKQRTLIQRINKEKWLKLMDILILK